MLTAKAPAPATLRITTFATRGLAFARACRKVSTRPRFKTGSGGASHPEPSLTT